MQKTVLHQKKEALEMFQQFISTTEDTTLEVTYDQNSISFQKSPYKKQKKSIADQTFGILKTDPKTLKEVMELDIYDQ